MPLIPSGLHLGAPASDVVDHFEQCPGEDVWLGTIRVFSANVHCYLIRVHVVDDVQQATRDPYGRLNDATNVAGDGAFETTKVPGLDGDFVVLAHAWCE
jgi:hypothetical protein